MLTCIQFVGVQTENDTVQVTCPALRAQYTITTATPVKRKKIDYKNASDYGYASEMQSGMLSGIVAPSDVTSDVRQMTENMAAKASVLTHDARLCGFYKASTQVLSIKFDSII